MKGPMRDLLASFRRADSKRPEGASHPEHPFTHLPHEVLDLLEAAYEAGRNAEAIEQWTREGD